jgi:hypothetical protein
MIRICADENEEEVKDYNRRFQRLSEMLFVDKPRMTLDKLINKHGFEYIYEHADLLSLDNKKKIISDTEFEHVFKSDNNKSIQEFQRRIKKKRNDYKDSLIKCIYSQSCD